MDQYSTNAQPTLKQPLTNTQLIGIGIGLVLVITQPILGLCIDPVWSIYWSMVVTITSYSKHDPISV